jgi:hypothetical protein
MTGKLKYSAVLRQVTPGKYPDGDGLYLLIAGPSSRSWAYRYWFKGKERWHGLGSLNEVSLRDARLKRDQARQRVRAGIDIVQANRSAREEATALDAATEAPTFQQCAEKYIDQNWTKWNANQRSQWPSSLSTYAYPTIGGLRIAEIKRATSLSWLKLFWVQKRETANHVRGQIETIIAKNVEIDDPNFRNPAKLTKQLREKLPKKSKRTIPSPRPPT